MKGSIKDLLRYVPARGHVLDLHKLLNHAFASAHTKSSLGMRTVTLVDRTPQRKPIFRLAQVVPLDLCWVEAYRSVWVIDLLLCCRVHDKNQWWAFIINVSCHLSVEVLHCGVSHEHKSTQNARAWRWKRAPATRARGTPAHHDTLGSWSATALNHTLSLSHCTDHICSVPDFLSVTRNTWVHMQYPGSAILVS